MTDLVVQALEKAREWNSLKGPRGIQRNAEIIDRSYAAALAVIEAAYACRTAKTGKSVLERAGDAKEKRDRLDAAFGAWATAVLGGDS